MRRKVGVGLNFGWGEVGDVGSWMREKMGVEEIVIGGWKVDEWWEEILQKFCCRF